MDISLQETPTHWLGTQHNQFQNFDLAKSIVLCQFTILEKSLDFMLVREGYTSPQKHV